MPIDTLETILGDTVLVNLDKEFYAGLSRFEILQFLGLDSAGLEKKNIGHPLVFHEQTRWRTFCQKPKRSKIKKPPI